MADQDTLTSDAMLSEEDFVEHFGKKGMKWGVRKSDSGGSSDGPAPKSRKELRGLNRAARQKDRQDALKKQAEDIKRNDKAIDAARERVNSGQGRREYLAAKAQYKNDKKQIGSYMAKKALNKVKQKNLADYQKSQELKSGKEQILGALAKVGAEAIANGAVNYARR